MNALLVSFCDQYVDSLYRTLATVFTTNIIKWVYFKINLSPNARKKLLNSRKDDKMFINIIT